MRTASEITTQWEWKERTPLSQAYWFGRVIHVTHIDRNRPNQFYVLIAVLQNTGHVVARGFWSTDIIEDNFYNKVENETTGNT